MPPVYALRVQTADGISWKPGPLHRKKPKFYVVIYQDGVEIHRTRTVRGEPAPKWDSILTIAGFLHAERGSSSDPMSSTFSLRLFHDSRLGDTCLGAADTDIATLANLCGSGIDAKAVKLDLIGVEKERKGRSVGTLFVSVMNAREGAALAIENTEKGVTNIGHNASASGLVAVGEGVAQVTPIAKDLGPALLSVTSKLGVIVSIGDEFAAALKQQQETDEKLLGLVKTMDDVYSFVGDIDFLPQKIKSVEDKALTIVKQTVECALFIQEYTVHGFSSRTVRSTWNHADKKIDELSAALKDLKRSFEGDLTVQSLFLSTKVLDVVERLDQSDVLKKLNPADMNATSRALCLTGTRREILDDIAEWLTVPSESGNVLWLSGVAGSGKSTISTTISESLRGLERLGAFLFFDRNDRARSHPDAVIRTIAYWLALSSPHLGSAISAAIRHDPAVVNAPLRTQFKELLLAPLQAAEQHIQGPIVVILDALDECGDPSSRLALLSLLSEEFPKLPHFLRRFLDTCSSSSNDVESFIRHEMARIRGLSWPGEETVKALVGLSGGLFIWASTAIKFMKSYRPNERLRILLSQDSTRGFNLDTLYSVALRSSAPWDTDKIFAEDARAVLICVVLGRVPITDETIDMILSSNKGSSANVLAYLVCVIEWTPGNRARTLHASFGDYLTDPTRSGGEPWAINTKVDHQPLSLGCLRILHSELKFNICGLEDSHCLNTDVPDIARRVTDNILPALAYSSCFWFNHVQETLIEGRVLEAIRRFMYDKVLYWLEVLSLLGKLPIATAALGVGIRYAKGQDRNLENFIADTIKFVATFAPLITQTLPFAPHGSRVVTQFGSLFPNILKTQGPLEEHWPSMQKIFSGSSHTLYIWDANTGAPIGHTGAVRSAKFSPDGARIVSASDDGTVRLWDAQTGILAGGSVDGPGDWVQSVHFSPDGTRIVCGLWDGTLHIWDAQTGEPVSGPLEGHAKWVTSIDFSPDGANIVSASGDETVFIRNAETGAPIRVIPCGMFEGHTKAVKSVCFSPDGTLIVSGSEDHTLNIWNTKTGLLVCGPLRGHTTWVNSVHFSPDGARIVSGSADYTVRIWDVETGAPIGEPLKGHTWTVTSVKFSPDGATIVSGACDRTLRIWDAQTGAPLGGPLTGHTNSIRSLTSSVHNPLGDSPRFKDDWVLNTAGEIMFWVPPWRRNGLYAPRNALVICLDGTTKLDLSRFVHGTEWTKCIDPSLRDVHGIGSGWGGVNEKR
ncbi:hypothetical protein B0H10DRAFT_1952189 [Mycena sp. CBHHK59/15]|nr:hypothetical protein B0H10DRAFT_1952189 [Mycena sp. CBHHK59/15]